jgi:hypothetical protein
MNFDVSSEQNHYAKTIHNTKCKHTFSCYYSTYRKKKCRFKGIIDATLNCTFRWIQQLDGLYHLRSYFW